MNAGMTCAASRVTGMRVLRASVLVLAGVPALAASAGCLEVVEDHVEPGEDQFGVTQVQWRGIVQNGCEAPYDGYLTVELLSAEGDSLYSVLVPVIVEAAGEAEVREKFEMRTERLDRAERTRVEVDQERERPI